MSWDEKAEDYAGAHHTYEHLGYGENMRFHKKFVAGAKWQRDQIRTDEAIERAADWLCKDDHGYTLAGHGKWCQDLAEVRRPVLGAPVDAWFKHRFALKPSAKEGARVQAKPRMAIQPPEQLIRCLDEDRAL